MAKRVPKEREIAVLAMLARGDTVREIAKTTEISSVAVSAIKKRNPEVFKYIQKRYIDKHLVSTTKILNKSNSLIERKLDTVEDDETTKNELLERYRNNEIDYKEYKRLSMGLIEASLSELTTVSREMANQLEKMKSDEEPKNQTSNSREQTEELLNLMKEGNHVELQRILFTPKEENA